MKYVRCDSHCKYPAYDKEEVDNLLLNKVYPIGSVYISVVETNPKVIFGGEWEQIKDTFLLSAGDTYEAGSSGGEAKHTLTYDEMPEHNHSIYHQNEEGWELENNFTVQEAGNRGYNSSVKTSVSGGNQPHNNMPPYLTVYMWKRIA